MNKKRIVFMGTASFSLAILKMLFDEDYYYKTHYKILTL